MTTRSYAPSSILALSRSKVPILASVLSSLLVSVVVSSTGFAQAGLRSQGLTNACVGFAEEQVLKDAACRRSGVPACDLNSNQWSYSIFDLLAAHSAFQNQVNPFLGNESLWYLMDHGKTLFAFPYLQNDTEVKSVRASKCTLEQEFFAMTQAKSLNPDREIPLFLTGNLYRQFKSGHTMAKEFQTAGLEEFGKILLALASESKSNREFQNRIFQYSRCSDRVELPQLKFKTESSASAQVIQETIVRELKAGHSIRAGVCADVLTAETTKKKGCAGHVIALKDLQGTNVLVVDSLFASKRAKNADGSMWLPLSVVTMAVQKSTADDAEKRKQSEDELAESRARLFASLSKAGLPLPGTFQSQVSELKWSLSSMKMMIAMEFEVIQFLEAKKQGRVKFTDQDQADRLVQLLAVLKALQAKGLPPEPSTGLTWPE